MVGVAVSTTMRAAHPAMARHPGVISLQGTGPWSDLCWAMSQSGMPSIGVEIAGSVCISAQGLDAKATPCPARPRMTPSNRRWRNSNFMVATKWPQDVPKSIRSGRPQSYTFLKQLNWNFCTEPLGVGWSYRRSSIRVKPGPMIFPILAASCRATGSPLHFSGPSGAKVPTIATPPGLSADCSLWRSKARSPRGN